MRVQNCTDLQTFYDHVLPFLRQREVENNIILGVMGDQLRTPPADSSAHYMGYVETDAGEVVAAAHFGGFRLITARPAQGYEAAQDLLLSDAASRRIEGLALPTELDGSAPELWLARTGRRLIPEMPMRAYRLDTVIPPTNVAGAMRWATPDDAFVTDWIIQFYISTFGHEPDEVTLVREHARFAAGSPYQLALWEVNGQPVCMGASIGLSPTGMRIGLVYTPVEQRGHGYASALVAALSQSILDSGLQFCTLNTDIHNPTSNKIYQAIGYYPVCDITVYDAEPVQAELHLRVQHCTDLQAFYDRVVPYLKQREAEHNMMLGTMGDLLRQPSAEAPAHAYMGYVETDAGEVVAAAHFGGFRLFLSYPAAGHEAAFEMLLNDAASSTIPRMLVPTAFDKSVAEIWLAKTGQRITPDFPMRAYRLDTVKAPTNVAGAMRWASPDEAFLVEWVHRFLVDTFGDDDPNYEARVKRQVARFTSGPYRMALWEVDGQPVSMAASIGLSPSGMRIGQVYTPDEQRGHGYASALVAALSQSLLDSGLQFCTLNTDIDNPTSNKIYQAIGYYPVCDQTMYEVDPIEGEESR